MTTPPNAPAAQCVHNWHDWQPGTVWCNRCEMVSARGNEGVPYVEPNAPEVDVLSVIGELINVPVIECIEDQQFIKEAKRMRAAVAELLTREAELVAERDALRNMWQQAEEDIADRNRTIECKNIDIRERDASLHGWAERAKKAESERDALAAEAGALREVLSSAEVLIEEWDRTDENPLNCMPGQDWAKAEARFRSAIDAARAEAGHG